MGGDAFHDACLPGFPVRVQRVSCCRLPLKFNRLLNALARLISPDEVFQAAAQKT